VPLEPLFVALGDSEARVRESALYALSNHPQEVPVERVVQALDDPNPYVRCAALTVLEQMGRARVPASVDQKLQEMAALEPHVNARKYAIKTLFVLKGMQPGSAHEYPGEATQD
jgi:HEAT repeat protein